MREIKFRCWQVEEFDEEDNPVKWEMIPADCLAFEDYEPLIDLLQSNEHKIFMQYTGLKDKNGKEIYEGDILKLRYWFREGHIDIIVKIDFDSGCFWFTGDGYTDCNWHHYNSKDREIIGNIYENQELLK